MKEIRGGRLSRARKLARGEDFDALWVSDAANVRYLSGFTGSSGYILLGGRRGYFITDSRYELQAAQEVQGLEVAVMRGRLTELLKELVAGMQVKRLAFSGEQMTFAEVEAFRRALKGAAVIQPLKGSLSGLRAVKDAGEIEAIRRAVARSEAALRRVLRMVQPGMGEKELAETLACELRRGGCQGEAFDTIVATGPRSALPHASPGNRRLGRRDILLVDWGARCAGYHSDETRVFFTKETSAEMRRIHALVLEAREKALMAIRPGARAAEVDKAARDVIAGAGYGKYFGHALGHGVGLEVHEAPVLSSLSRDMLRPGMVFTVEPGIYLPGKGGVRIEDVIHLEAGGPRVLSRIARSGELPRH